MMQYDKPQHIDIFMSDGSCRTMVITALGGADGILEVRTRDYNNRDIMVIINWKEISELAVREATYGESQEIWYPGVHHKPSKEDYKPVR